MFGAGLFGFVTNPTHGRGKMTKFAPLRQKAELRLKNIG